jgi:hypothetical protein
VPKELSSSLLITGKGSLLLIVIRSTGRNSSANTIHLIIVFFVLNLAIEGTINRIAIKGLQIDMDLGSNFRAPKD